MIFVTNDLKYFAWVENQTGIRYDPRLTTFVVSENTYGEIKACIALYNYILEERRLDWSIISTTRHWGSNEMAACLIDYIYNRLNVHRLQGFVGTPEAEELLCKLGFTLDTNLTDWFGPGKDAKLYSLLSTKLENTKFWEMAVMYYKKAPRSEGLLA